MLFDLTYLETNETFRYKPKNKVSCKGTLLYHDKEIASLDSLAIVHSTDPAMISGRFSIEWHRMNQDDSFTEGELNLKVEYTYKDEYMYTWKIFDIQILYEGVPLAIRSLSDVMGAPIIFFSTNMEFSNA